MFENAAEELFKKKPLGYEMKQELEIYTDGFKDGYNKAKEDARLKLKDKGIIQPLKSSILRNERLSSQEQQELCAWIECAMDFGENLDECAKELEEANKANEWHYVKDGDLPKDENRVLLYFGVDDYNDGQFIRGRFWCGCCGWFDVEDVIAWKEIELPKEIKEK